MLIRGERLLSKGLTFIFQKAVANVKPFPVYKKSYERTANILMLTEPTYKTLHR